MRTVGRYTLWEAIATGGMATVHLGRMMGAEGFAKTVAVKRLHPHLASDPELAAMFVDEARLVSRLQHPNIVPTFDVVADDGELLLVMEHVLGETLAGLLQRTIAGGRRCPPRIAAAILCGALRGLHHAHEATAPGGEPLHLVHRDVSPQNILVGVDGVARILDFGIAKVIAGRRMYETRDGSVRGKLPYMPPETLEGAAVDRRVDVYAAAVCLWEAVAGARLFAASSDAEVVRKVLDHDVPLLSERVPGVTRFDEIIRRGLAIERADRYPTAHEMALAIEQGGLASATEVAEWVLSTARAQIESRACRIAELEASSADETPAVVEKPSPRPRGRAWRVAIGLAAIAAIALGLVRASRTAPPAAVPITPATAVPTPSTSAEPIAPPSAEPTPVSSPSPRPRPIVRPSVKPRSSAVHVGCDPPYTLDDSGRKQYKLECLR
jgi:eukaryotic-like serine/threonine-protein kinase